MPVKTTTKRKSSAHSLQSGGFMSTKLGKFVGVFVIVLIIVVIVTTLISLHSLPNKKLSTTKQQNTIQQKKTSPVDIQTYDYTHMLETKELDTGSGIKNNHNYEADTAKKEAAYRRELERKRRAKQEALEAKAKHEAELRQKALEKKRLAAERRKQKQLEASNKTQKSVAEHKTIQFADLQKTKGKFYVQCNSDNYRTAKEAEAQKAKLAFNGKQSTIVLKKMGGGYVYSLNIGPYNSLNDAIKARNGIITANLARNCSAVN